MHIDIAVHLRTGDVLSGVVAVDPRISAKARADLIDHLAEALRERMSEAAICVTRPHGTRTVIPTREVAAIDVHRPQTAQTD